MTLLGIAVMVFRIIAMVSPADGKDQKKAKATEEGTPMKKGMSSSMPEDGQAEEVASSLLLEVPRIVSYSELERSHEEPERSPEEPEMNPEEPERRLEEPETKSRKDERQKETKKASRKNHFALCSQLLSPLKWSKDFVEDTGSGEKWQFRDFQEIYAWGVKTRHVNKRKKDNTAEKINSNNTATTTGHKTTHSNSETPNAYISSALKTMDNPTDRALLKDKWLLFLGDSQARVLAGDFLKDIWDDGGADWSFQAVKNRHSYMRSDPSLNFQCVSKPGLTAEEAKVRGLRAQSLTFIEKLNLVDPIGVSMSLVIKKTV